MSNPINPTEAAAHASQALTDWTMGVLERAAEQAEQYAGAFTPIPADQLDTVSPALSAEIKEMNSDPLFRRYAQDAAAVSQALFGTKTGPR
ncbi:MAG: hypothetical protein AB7G06_00385 [Bdellovibrionales bacterium]